MNMVLLCEFESWTTIAGPADNVYGYRRVKPGEMRTCVGFGKGGRTWPCEAVRVSAGSVRSALAGSREEPVMGFTAVGESEIGPMHAAAKLKDMGFDVVGGAA